MREPFPLSGKNLLRTFQSFVLSFADFKGGRISSSKEVDMVFEDIFGKKKMMERVCRARNLMDMRTIFNEVDLNDLAWILSRNETSFIISDLIRLKKEIKNLTIKYQRASKKGASKKKKEGIKKQLAKLRKRYRNGVKILRNEIGVSSKDKTAKFKDKYRALDEYIKRNKDPYFIDAFEYDYDDDDDIDFSESELDLIGNRPRPKRRYAGPDTSGINPIFLEAIERQYGKKKDNIPEPPNLDLSDEEVWDDDDDLTQGDEDESYTEYLEEKIDDIVEQNSAILSLTSALMSKLGINADAKDTVPEAPENKSDIDALKSCVEMLTKNQERMMDVLDKSLSVPDVEVAEEYDDVSNLMENMFTEADEVPVAETTSEFNPKPVKGEGLVEEEEDEPRKVEVKVEVETTEKSLEDMSSAELIDEVNKTKGKQRKVSSKK